MTGRRGAHGDAENHAEPASSAPPYGLGPDWPIGPGGWPYREAARVVVLDAAGRALLVRGHDRAKPAHSWWFTVGGGLEAGEDPRVGACRELREETGLDVGPGDLEGPVLHRDSLFEFATITCRQVEQFFLLRLEGVDDARGLDGSAGWTDLEREVLDELRWWSAEDLRAEQGRGTLVFPASLPDLLARWREGWDPQEDVPSLIEHGFR